MPTCRHSRSGRPYRPPLRGNRRRGRRGGLYGRPCAPTCWMHHRRTHPARYRQQKHHRRTYPLWGRVRRWCEIPGAGGRCSRFRADIQSAPTVWTEVHAVGGVARTGGWRADVGIGPYEAEPSNLAKIGSRSGRPYRPPLRGNRRRGRRGGFYIRPCAPTCWMHHRRTYPLWGRVRRWCEIPRAGGRCSRFWADIQSAPTGEEAPIPGENREPVSGGHAGRPYEKARSLFADGDV